MNSATGFGQHTQADSPPHRQRIKVDYRLDWAFEVIELRRPGGAGSRPTAAVIEIEADLLGFLVRLTDSDRLVERQFFLPTLEEAILEAGRLVHERLAEGYVVSRGASV